MFLTLRSTCAWVFALGLPAISAIVPFPASAAGSTSGPIAARSAEIPAEFPTFKVPGHDAEMAALRDLYWHHYQGLTPKATLWDEWLLPPTIWPAIGAEKAAASWRNALSKRHIAPDGYVATHQHQSIAHQEGWPFPHWAQGGRGFGWHFSYHNTVGPGWRPDHVANFSEWTTSGTELMGAREDGLALRLTSRGAQVSPPNFSGAAYEAPFVQIRWQADGLGTTATPYLEWTSDATPSFSRQRRFYFDPPKPGSINYTTLPVYRHPQWTGTITGLRLGFDNVSTGTEVVLQALFAQYDTRHNINNPSYVSACIDYFSWTGDLNFLRQEIERMRLAMRFMETEFGTETDGIVTVPWVGHEGTGGISRNADGSVRTLHGRGVGNNYWDLLPFGKQDSYATIRHYAAALKMADLEQALADNPGWNIAASPLAQSADHWRAQAQMGKENGNRLFWNEITGRFTLGIDGDGGQADYGFTFLNLEAIAYGFATEDHARQIMEWISGRRTVESDTAQTTDIYHWRFAPRATTRRNIDHYGWFWNGADSIPWGGQVQDGGAVMGFSYHDIMARLRAAGPDDAARRLGAIADWYADVVGAGGYRAYYDGSTREGTLQGGGTAGGLGLDREFFESVMVPQVLLEGFGGLRPTPDGMTLNPQLPAGWKSLTIDKIVYRNREISLHLAPDKIELIPATAAGTQDMMAKVTIARDWQPQDEPPDMTSATGIAGTRTVTWDMTRPLVLQRR